MTTQAILRKAALTFPEADEDVRDGEVVYSVRGKPFASLTTDGTVQLRLPEADAKEAIARYPAAERLLHAGRPIGFRAPLGDVDGQHLWALVMAAWKHRAPKRAAAKLTAIVGSPDQAARDLPAAIGKAATRALATAGITTLDEVADHSEADLLAMHGVGPKAVRILADALAEQGKALR
jgi:hypothetical protein